MKDPCATQTAEVFEPIKRGRGRPVTGHAMTNAERQKAYRQRKKALPKTVTATQNPDFELLQTNRHLLEQAKQWHQLCTELRAENDLLKQRIDELETRYRNEITGQGAQARIEQLFKENEELAKFLDIIRVPICSIVKA